MVKDCLKIREAKKQLITGAGESEFEILFFLQDFPTNPALLHHLPVHLIVRLKNQEAKGS